MTDPLSPARGVLVGFVLGVALWAAAILLASAIVASMRPSTTCSTGPYDVYAVRGGQQVVRCP